MLNRENEDIQTDIRNQNEKQKQDQQELKALDDQIQSAIHREKTNQSEILSLKSTLQKITQDRDLLVAQHQEQIKAQVLYKHTHTHNLIIKIEFRPR